MSSQEYSSAQVAMRNVSNPAVFTRNFPSRLEDAVQLSKVTHRANKPWRSAQIGIERHGELPAYIKSRGEEENVITHIGTIEDVIVNPADNPDKADRMREHIADRDTWSEYFDDADTLYLLSDCRELEPENRFPFTRLKKLVNGETLPASYSRQPAYVHQVDK
ncbi:hypothetical protein [Natronolimnobius baerhuensis]|uniref:hypothetical protein n=1 Tax=Natronolimnobius baerhuensis TaxID=253108 RepID=UPI001124FA18|nr:hypothetical protein [Natronolimnobius baerhuensis]